MRTASMCVKGFKALKVSVENDSRSGKHSIFESCKSYQYSVCCISGISTCTEIEINKCNP